MKKILPRVLLFVAMATAVVSLAQIVPSANTAEPRATKLPKTVPAAVQNLTVTPDGINPYFTIEFDLPSTNYGGEEQDEYEQITYSVEVNGELVKDNVTAYWCDKGISLDESISSRCEEVSVTVWATNDDGDGPKTTVTAVVGEDEALPVTEFNAEFDGTNFNLSWSPLQTVKGGTCDVNYVKYKIYSYPGGELAGTFPYSTSETTLAAMNMPSGEYYFTLVMEYYQVYDQYTNTEHPAVKSNIVVVNPESTPVNHTITKSSSLNIEDANGDDTTWSLSDNGASYGYNTYAAADDWLYSMPITLDADHNYKLTAIALCSNSQFPERIEVKAGAHSTVDDMTISVVGPTDLTTGNDEELTGVFEVEEAGTYVIGFHAISDADMYGLRLISFSVEENEALSMANAPVGTIEPYYYDNQMQVKTSVTLPTTSIRGRQLGSIDQFVIERNGLVVYTLTKPEPGSKVEYLDTVEDAGDYTYTAYAVVSNQKGRALEQEISLTSSFLVPDFTLDLTDTNNTLNYVKVFDVNGDGIEWKATTSGLKITYNTDEAMNDWVILTLPIIMTEGISYRVDVTASNDNNYAEAFDVYLTEGTTLDAKRTLVYAGEEFNGEITASGTFDAQYASNRYLAIYGHSPADRNYLCITGLIITAVGECDKLQDKPNLGITAIDVPNAEAGNAVDVTVRVVNNGPDTFAGYTATLYVDDEKYDTVKGSQLASLESEDIVFSFNTSLFDAGKTFQIYATIEAEGDEIADDNTSETKTIEVAASVYPAPTDLKAVVDGNTVSLSWTEPNSDNNSIETVTEDFESYPAFSIGSADSEVEGDNVGDWTIVDVDGKTNYIFGGNDPNFNSTNRTFGWIIMNTEQTESSSIVAASGVQAIMAGCAYPASPDGNDDWLISPQLSGKAQTISFKAARYSSSVVENFQVLTSTTGKEVADFTTTIGEETITADPQEFVDYSFDLPEGSKYFAIRCVSYDAFALFIDDVTYERIQGLGNIELVSYNVYRDQELIGTTAADTTTYTDSDVENGTHQYQVSAVWDLGQSVASEAAVAIVMDSTGLNTATVGGITVSAANHVITVSGAAGQVIDIYSIDGRRIASTVGSEETTFDVASGIYLVRAGNTVVKVLAN